MFPFSIKKKLIIHVKNKDKLIKNIELSLWGIDARSIMSIGNKVTFSGPSPVDTESWNLMTNIGDCFVEIKNNHLLLNVKFNLFHFFLFVIEILLFLNYLYFYKFINFEREISLALCCMFLFTQAILCVISYYKVVNAIIDVNSE